MAAELYAKKLWMHNAAWAQIYDFDNRQKNWLQIYDFDNRQKNGIEVTNG